MKRIDLTHKWVSYFGNPLVTDNARGHLFLYSEVILFSDRLTRDVTYGIFGHHIYVYHRNSYIPYCDNKQLCQSTF